MKNPSNQSIKLFYIFAFIIFFRFDGLTQNLVANDFQYISPIPGSEMNSPETNIIIRYGKPFKQDVVTNQKIFIVKGELSGIHQGRIKLTEDNRTLLFVPQIPFAEGENVSVGFSEQLRTVENESIPDLNFYFKVSDSDLNKKINNNPEKFFHKLNIVYNLLPQTSVLEKLIPKFTVMDATLPPDFPAITADSINLPTPGNIFLCPFPITGSNGNYLIIIDNMGIPVFYRKTNGSNFDFKKQPGNLLTYFNSNGWKYYVLDSSYNLIDSVTIRNGYSTDVHDLTILNNNHYLLMGYDNQYVRMDTIVPGGNPNAIVTGIVIQELDENKDVIFQWRSFDHFQITDATYDIVMTDSIIDYVHSNAIELDNDGNLILSSRHMDEVTKINRQTGNIIWRWGGEYCENNQFTFINDSQGFSHQHDIRRLSNGNLTLFDNGNLHSPQFSRAAEYQLDEINKLAFLVWEHKNDPSSFSSAMGSVQRFPNHNSIIGWGLSSNNPAISEVRADGSVELFVTLPDSFPNYRALKFSWKSDFFVTDSDSLIFGFVPAGDSLIKSLQVTNNSNEQIEINDYYVPSTVYRLVNNLPIIIPPLGSVSVSVKFKPGVDGNYFDDLHLRYNRTEERIAQVVKLVGSTDSNFTFVNSEFTSPDYNLEQNYPNPFNPSTKISWHFATENKVTLVVYDILGREVKILVNDERPAGNYAVTFNASNLPSGIYFYTLRSGHFAQTKKMILLK